MEMRPAGKIYVAGGGPTPVLSDHQPVATRDVYDGRAGDVHSAIAHAGVLLVGLPPTNTPPLALRTPPLISIELAAVPL